MFSKIGEVRLLQTLFSLLKFIATVTSMIFGASDLDHLGIIISNNFPRSNFISYPRQSKIIILDFGDHARMDHFCIIFIPKILQDPWIIIQIIQKAPKNHPITANHWLICREVRLAPLELPTFPGVPQAAAVSPLPTMPGFALSAGLQAPVELKAVAEAQAAAELLKEIVGGLGWDGDFGMIF